MQLLSKGRNWVLSWPKGEKTNITPCTAHLVTIDIAYTPTSEP